MFIAALFTVAENCKQLKCPSKDQWINKLSHVHIHKIEYYLVTKKNKLLIQTWMNLKILMANERSQAKRERERDPYCA